MDAYVEAGGLKERDSKETLFRSVNRKRELTDRPLSRVEVFLMIERRVRACSKYPIGNSVRPRTTLDKSR